jgi:hypothetical protein
MKKTNYKLQLKRTTLSNLSQSEMGNLKGGIEISIDPNPTTSGPTNPSNQFTCLSHLYTECLTNTRFLCATRRCTIQPL